MTPAPSPPRSRAFVAALLLAAGFAGGLQMPVRLLADGAVYVAMADSLWSDGDLAWGPDDLTRASGLGISGYPRGLFLAKHEDGYRFAKPALYPAVAAPFYAAFGVRGFFALNGILLAALLLLGADILAHRLPWGRALALAATVLASSVTPVYLLWVDPFLLLSVLIAGAVAAWRRRSAFWSAACIIAAASCRPPYLMLALAPLALWGVARDWRLLRRFAVGAAAAAVLLLGVARLGTGHWLSYGGARYFYASRVPFADGDPNPQGAPADLIGGRTWRPDLGTLARGNLELVFGRFAGVLPYFPGLLICALWSRRWDREKVAWLLALVASCEALIIIFPHNTMGGTHALGNRLFVLLPVALLFVDFLAWRSWRLLGTVLLLLPTAPLLRDPAYFSLHPGRQMLLAPYRMLPLEWGQAGRIGFPFQYPLRMAALTDHQYGWEGDGVWTHGGQTAEFVIITVDERPPRVRLWSFQPDVQVRDGGVAVAQDWLPGREVEIALAHPVAVYRDESYAGTTIGVYTLSVGTATGTMANTVGSPTDDRYLGVLVSPVAPSPP